MDAWWATVRVEGRGISWPQGKCPRQRMRKGSGTVVKLTNLNGEVLGVNTIIEGRVEPADKHEFCAALDSQNPGECVHVAISSREVIKEFEQFYPSRLTVADCALPSERHKKRQ